MNVRFHEVLARTTAFASILGALLCATCSSHEGPDRDNAPPSQALLRSLGSYRTVLDFAERYPAFREGDGYRIRPQQRLLATRSGRWDVVHRPTEAWVPAQADQAMRLQTTGAGELAIRRVGATAAPGRLERGALLFANAVPGHDAMMFAGDRGIHDLLLPKVSGVKLGYDVELPAGWELHSIKGAEQLVEVRDRAGIARLRLILRGGLDAAGKGVVVRAKVVGTSIAIQGDSPELASVHAEWEGTGTLAFDREWPVTTLLRTGKVLVTGELPGLPLEYPHTGELYDPISSTFTVTAAFEGFKGKAVVQLPTGPNETGLVVAFGKAIEKFPLHKTDIAIYDPDRDDGKQILPPGGFFPENALVLSDGKVFVCGRDRSEEAWDSHTAWVFDPKTEDAREVAAIREHHLAGMPVLLPSGKVAVIGRGGLHAIYEPTTGNISGDAIDDPADLVVLADGRILVFNDDGTATILDLVSGKREPVRMPENSAKSVGIRLSSGKVLVVAAGGAQLHPASYVFDPVSRSFSQAEKLDDDGAYHRPALTYLPGGGVLLLTRGDPSGSSTGAKAAPQVYIPAWETRAIRSLRVQRRNHSATMLASGKLLVAGGDKEGTAEIYDPKTHASRIVAKLLHPREGHTANLLLPSGKVLLVGGNKEVAEAELFNPATETFERVPLAHALPIVQGHQATTLPSGKVLITGGSRIPLTNTSAQGLAEIYDPGANAFTTVPSMIRGRVDHAATLLESGNVLIVGGAQTGTQAGAHAELFDTRQNTFVATGAARDEAYRASAARLPSGEVLIVAQSWR